MWGLIFEKMAAKFYGSYEVIDGGESSEGVEVMTGAPYKDYKHSDIKNDNVKKENFWQDLLLADSEKGSVVGNSSMAVIKIKIQLVSLLAMLTLSREF